MKDIDYQQLPETISSEFARDCFLEIIEKAKKNSGKNSLLILKDLCEVSERYWRTFEPLDPCVKETIDEWLSLNWDKESIDSVKMALRVTALLGLSRTMDSFRQSVVKDALSQSIRLKILNAINEFGGTVSDPYSGMR